MVFCATGGLRIPRVCGAYAADVKPEPIEDDGNAPLMVLIDEH